MTSRRAFLISSSSVPLLSVAGHFAVAKPFEQSQFSDMRHTQPDADFSQAEMGIYGWHTPQTDTAQTHLICLSASWKADWL